MKKQLPNILWICCDQQRYNSISGLGNPFLKTPNIDRLIDEGTAFLRAYTQCPVCTPSRASFLTGRYPRTTRVLRNGNEYFPPDETLVTKLFANYGYDCGLVGKLHLSAAEGMVEVRPDDGYRFFEWSEHPHDDWEEGHDYQKWLKNKGIIWDEHYPLGNGKNQSSEGNAWKESLPEGKGGIEAEYHQTTWAFERAMAFIDEARGNKPWLMSINIFDPHPPFDPPLEYRKRFDIDNMPLPLWKEGELDNKPFIQKEDYLKGSQGGTGPCCSTKSDKEKKQLIADYYAQIELIDDNVGKILKHLEETGQRDNTIILYHSDHGEMLGDHGLYWKGAYVYEQLIHVPMIFSWPGKITNNLKSNALVELVDIAPTLLELAGFEVPFYMQGKSLAPILTGAASPDFHKDHIYCEYYNAMEGVHDRHISVYFDGRIKIAVHHNEEVGELYDLENDPNEFYNLWDNPDYEKCKLEYMKKCFDSTIMANMDPKPRVIRYF
ncbi:MAG: sulfatase [Acetivibrionales bacterium]|jgi:arylsulfatase